MEKFTPHAILERKGKRGSVIRGEKREHVRQGSQKRTGRNSGNTGSSEQRRRRVTFVLDFR
jgi:hypothetical protein